MKVSSLNKAGFDKKPSNFIIKEVNGHLPLLAISQGYLLNSL
jgi:hypothetical protein